MITLLAIPILIREREFLDKNNDDHLPPLKFDWVELDLNQESETKTINYKHTIPSSNDAIIDRTVQAGNLLETSEVRNIQLEFENLIINLPTLLESCLSFVRELAQKKGLNLSIHYLPPLPLYIRSDPVRLHQIITNLLNNAVKFTHQGTIEILVNCNIQQELLAVSILDRNVAMDDQQRERLFRPFIATNHSNNQEYLGAGLGLALSRQLTQMLGGDLRTDNDFGIGSLFTAYIPTGTLKCTELITDLSVWNRSQSTSMTILPSDPPHFVGRVLLAEDNPYNQQILGQRLIHLGIEVVVVGDGEAATMRAIEENFDIILMDIQMPVMDGLEATRLLRRASCPVPIIALIAHPLKIHIDQARAAGCDDFLSKPVDWGAFYRVLAMYLPTADKNSSKIPILEKNGVQAGIEKSFYDSLPSKLVEMAQAMEELESAPNA